MKRIYQYSLRAIVALLFAVVFAPSALAVGPAINAKVYDGQPAELTVTTPDNAEVVGTSPITLEGSVRNISQIMVYIDGAYSTTYALDDGATYYSFTISLSPGEHTVKLVAVNPYEGTTIESTFTVTYTPGQTSLPAETVKNVSQTAQASKQYLQDQVDQASGTGPASILSESAFTFMKAVDLISIDSSDSLPQSLSRFAAVVGGLTMLLFANPILWLYHFIRYHLLRWNVHALPKLVHHHALLVIHIAGALSLFGAFLI